MPRFQILLSDTDDPTESGPAYTVYDDKGERRGTIYYDHPRRMYGYYPQDVQGEPVLASPDRKYLMNQVSLKILQEDFVPPDFDNMPPLH